MGVDDIVLLEVASQDLLAGRRFYERRQKDLGSYFWQCLLSDLESLKIYAGVHTKVNGYYRMMSKRFPFTIYYDVVDNIAYVIAILPFKKNPIWISTALSKRPQY